MPSKSDVGNALPDAAIIVSADGSTAGFDALTGGVRDYTIYKNGVRVTTRELKQYDVATYQPDTNAILVTDTRVNVWYENCKPSPSAPEKIVVLETVFEVLPTAQQSLSVYKPGQAMTVFFTADGRIAGAAARDSGVTGNAYAYVDGDGKVSMICGGSLIALDCTANTNVANKVGRLSQTKSGSAAAKVTVSPQNNNDVRGELDVLSGKIGSTKVADNALILYNGELTALSAVKERTIHADRIIYVRTNANDEADILVIGDQTVEDEVYGRALIEGTYNAETGRYTHRQISIDCGANGSTGTHDTGYDLDYGTVVAAKYHKDGPPYFDYIKPMEKLANVPNSAWVGKSAVVVNGRTYTIPGTVICWNDDAKEWFADFDTAFDYGGTRDLYVKDGVVRVIEIRG